jgi:hypothetical protein
MAFPTATVGAYSNGATDLDVMFPSIWGERINDFFRANLVMAPFFTDRSEELADGGRILYTPSVTEFTATAKSNATAVTLVSPNEANVTLTVNQWYEASFAIEDREAAQVKRSYVIQENYARSAGFAVAKKLDTDIATLFSGFSQSVGASTASVADSNIRAAIAYLDSANVPSEDRAFFVNPNVFWNQLQGIDRFALAINSPSQDPVAKRPLAYLYGIPVYITTQIQYVSGTTGRYNALAHKDAIHWATSPLGAGGSKGSMTGSMGVRVQSNYIPEYLSTLTTADILYGVIENRDTAGVRILTSAS